VQISVVHGTEWFFEVGGAIFADCQQPIRHADVLLATYTVQTLAHRLGDGCRHAFSRQPRKFLSQLIRLLTLDV
jgi:hypothetical protein